VPQAAGLVVPLERFVIPAPDDTPDDMAAEADRRVSQLAARGGTGPAQGGA
jgi:hypothetical protein